MSLIKSGTVFGDAAFPVAAGRISSRDMKQIDMHRHEYYELLYVEKGSLISRFKGSEVRMKAGDLVLIKPFALHLLEDNKDSTAWFCSFQPQVVDIRIQPLEELKNTDSPNKYFFKPFMGLTEEQTAAVVMNVSPAHRAEMGTIFRDLQDTARLRTERGNALTRFHFLSLLSLLAGRFEQGMEARCIKVGGSSVPTSRYLSGFRETLNHIHDHLADPLTLDSMAAMCGADKHYFCRLFKNETGTTFTSYLNGLRIEKACTMLRNSTENLQDICYTVGYNKYLCFNRQFKKYTGLAPSEFRKQAFQTAALPGLPLVAA